MSCLTLAAAAPWPCAADASHPGLPLAFALDQSLAQANRQGSPLVVMVSLDGCVFCRAVRESHLVPLAREGLPVIQVDWRSSRALRDFSGHAATHDDMVRRWSIRVAPTLLFFGPGGREVADRMDGSYLPDFYRGYLEARLAQARQAIAR